MEPNDFSATARACGCGGPFARTRGLQTRTARRRLSFRREMSASPDGCARRLRARRSRILRTMLLCAAACMTITVRAEARTPLRLSEAEALAVRANPSLEGLRQAAAGLRHAAVAVGELPDPRLSLGAENVPLSTFSLRQQQMSVVQVGVSQAFPPWGALAARRRKALFTARAAIETGYERRAEVIFLLRQAWFAALYAQKAAAAIAREEDLARETLAAARARYRAGRATLADVLRAELAAGSLRNRADRLHAASAAARARIAQILARPRPPVLDTRWPVLHVPGPANMRARVARQPTLLAARDKWRAARAAVGIAKSAYWPAITVSAAYGKDFFPGSPNWLSVGLDFSLPIFPEERQDQGLDAARARKLEAHYRYEDHDLALLRRLRSAESLHAALKRELARTESSLLPTARAAFSAALDSYAAGRVDMTGALAAQRRVLKYALLRLNDRKDLETVAAEIDWLTTQRSGGTANDQ